MENISDVKKMELAVKAFEFLDADYFSVSAVLSADRPETLEKFKKFQDLLAMIYAEGMRSMRESERPTILKDRGFERSLRSPDSVY